LQTWDVEESKAIVVKLAELASLTPALTRSDIVAAHRVGNFKTELPPYSIVKFVSKDQRNKIYSEVRGIDSLTPKKIFPEVNEDTKIYIIENLTPRRNYLKRLAKRT